MTLHDPVAGSSRLRFVKTGNAAFLFLIAPIDQVGNRIRSMGTSLSLIHISPMKLRALFIQLAKRPGRMW